MKKILLLVATVVIMAAPAMADYSGNYKYDGYVNGGSGWVGGDGLTEYRNVLWSQYWLQKQGGPRYLVECIDMVQWADGNYRPYNDVALTAAPLGSWNAVMTDTEANRLRELFTEHWQPTTTNANDRAAFQLATWEIVYQRGVTDVNTYDVRSGWDMVADNGFEIKPGTSYSTTAANTANNWLRSLNGVNNNLDSGMDSDEFMNVRALVNDTYQDWAFYVDEMGVIPVPGAALLGLLGFSLIGWVKRRFA